MVTEANVCKNLRFRMWGAEKAISGQPETVTKHSAVVSQC